LLNGGEFLREMATILACADAVASRFVQGETGANFH